MKYKFEIGDIVECIKPIPNNSRIEGKSGRIIGFCKPDVYSQSICVEFFENIKGHDGCLCDNKRGKNEHCWFVNPDNLDFTFKSLVIKIRKRGETK